MSNTISINFSVELEVEVGSNASNIDEIGEVLHLAFLRHLRDDAHQSGVSALVEASEKGISSEISSWVVRVKQ